jgi:hypothetical protein
MYRLLQQGSSLYCSASPGIPENRLIAPAFSIAYLYFQSCIFSTFLSPASPEAWFSGDMPAPFVSGIWYEFLGFYVKKHLLKTTTNK